MFLCEFCQAFTNFQWTTCNGRFLMFIFVVANTQLPRLKALFFRTFTFQCLCFAKRIKGGYFQNFLHYLVKTFSTYYPNDCRQRITFAVYFRPFNRLNQWKLLFEGKIIWLDYNQGYVNGDVCLGWGCMPGAGGAGTCMVCVSARLSSTPLCTYRNGPSGRAGKCLVSYNTCQLLRLSCASFSVSLPPSSSFSFFQNGLSPTFLHPSYLNNKQITSLNPIPFSSSF